MRKQIIGAIGAPLAVVALATGAAAPVAGFVRWSWFAQILYYVPL